MLIWAAIALHVGCSDSSSTGGGDECVRDTECEAPKVCRDGQCEFECRRDMECPQPGRCVEDVCRSPSDMCFADVDCAIWQLVCDRSSGACVEAGACDPISLPCPAGLTCVGGACIDPGSDSGTSNDAGRTPERDASRPDAPDAAPPDAKDAEPIPPADAADPVADAAPQPDAGGPRDREYGQTCVRGNQCRSGFCVENKLRGTRQCTSLCERDEDCPGLDTCLEARDAQGESTRVCVPNETGFPCDDPRHCTSGICLQPPSPGPWVNVQSICVAVCPGDHKCPAGFACQLTQSQGGDIRVCAPDVQLFQCPDGDAMLCGGICDVAPEIEPDVVRCVAVGEGVTGYCSCTCVTGADCPRGFACNPLDTGDPARQGLCLAMAGFNCAQEATNPDFGQCPSLTCGVNDELPIASYCTAMCRRDNDCPEGFRCERINAQDQVCTARQ